jgi:hypothetical protein
VENLIAWCRKGPPSARVENVDVQWLPADEPGKSSFVIAY